MKIKKSILIVVTLLIYSLIIVNCTAPEKEIYNRLMEHANTIKVINTHEHQRNANELDYTEFNFWVLLNHSYLMSDVVSAGGSYMNSEMLAKNTPDQMWELNGKYLDYCSETSYYQHFLEGFKKCYGYKELSFSEEDVEMLSQQIGENYKDFDKWFDSCFQIGNFETMFIDQFWNPFNLEVDKKYFTLIFPVNNLIKDIASAKTFSDENQEFNAFKKESGTTQIQTLKDYLKYADFILNTAITNGAVGLKNSMAYKRSIDYENVPEEIATRLFRQAPSLNKEETKQLQDFMFHWILDKAAEYDLTVQIHTGYLAGNGNQLDNGKPVKLNNLFLEHRKTRFDLFHGGFPWTGEFVALGKMFPNVYLNLVWLSQISKNRAEVTFNEMLDCVPYNKMLWGGDCQLIEETVGSLEYGKQVVCKVLAHRISEGQMDESMAKKIIAAVFRENAIEIFKLKIN